MRLFIALTLEDENKTALASVQGRLRRYAQSARLTRSELLHLTLAFLGELPDAAAVESCLAAVHSPAFSFAIEGVGRFSSREGDIVWAGIGEQPLLRTLHSRVCAALRAGGIPFDPKPFRPHLTLARQARFAADGYTRFAQSLPQAPITTVRADWFSLMHSHRADGRLCYTELAAYRLGDT